MAVIAVNSVEKAVPITPRPQIMGGNAIPSDITMPMIF